MLDYTAEADRYDATRGGERRAGAAARAALSLLPAHTTTLLDVACGTGIVTTRLRRPGLAVSGADRSPGMARLAAARLPGTVLIADAAQLPLQDNSFDALTAVWLLHLLDDAAPVLAEAARVLRPGGVLVTTVDKVAGHDVGSDIDAVLAPYRQRAGEPADSAERVVATGRAYGLEPAGEARFPGHGQGRAPRVLAASIRAGGWRLYPPETADAVAALPDPGRRRPDPAFRLLALRRAGR